MKTYKNWPLLDEIPQGWAIDKTAGSPLCGYAFVTNCKSPLKGQERALLRVVQQQQGLPFNDLVVVSKMEIATVKQAKPSGSFVFDASQAKTVNDLARQKFKHKLLNDILVDLTICEIEGWSQTEYINELKSLINSIGKTPA